MINIGELKNFEELVKELDKIERKYYEQEAVLAELQEQKAAIEERISKKLEEKEDLIKEFNKTFKMKSALSQDNTIEDVNSQIFTKDSEIA